MAIILKNRRQIQMLRDAGRLVAHALDAVGRLVKPGVTTAELDFAAELIIREAGATPA